MYWRIFFIFELYIILILDVWSLLVSVILIKELALMNQKHSLFLNSPSLMCTSTIIQVKLEKMVNYSVSRSSRAYSVFGTLLSLFSSSKIYFLSILNLVCNLYRSSHPSSLFHDHCKKSWDHPKIGIIC